MIHRPPSIEGHKKTNTYTTATRRGNTQIKRGHLLSCKGVEIPGNVIFVSLCASNHGARNPPHHSRGRSLALCIFSNIRSRCLCSSRHLEDRARERYVGQHFTLDISKVDLMMNPEWNLIEQISYLWDVRNDSADFSTAEVRIKKQIRSLMEKCRASYLVSLFTATREQNENTACLKWQREYRKLCGAPGLLTIKHPLRRTGTIRRPVCCFWKIISEM